MSTQTAVNVKEDRTLRTQWRCKVCSSLNNKVAIIGKDGCPQITCWHCHSRIKRSEDGKWYTDNVVTKNIQPGEICYTISELDGKAPVQISLHEEVEINNYRWLCPGCHRENLIGVNSPAFDRKKFFFEIRDVKGDFKEGVFGKCAFCPSVISRDADGDWFEMERK